MPALFLAFLLSLPGPGTGPPCGDGGLLARGEAANLARDPLSALLAYEEAARLHPGCGRAWVGLAESWLRLGLAEQGYSSLEAALEDPERSAGAHLARGVLALRLGRREEASASFAEATSRDPGMAAAWIRRAGASLEGLRLRRSWQEIERAIALDSEDPEIYQVLERWVETGGESRSLVALLEGRLASGDRAALAGLEDLFFRLAVKRTRQGRPRLAIAYYRQALRCLEGLGDKPSQVPVLLNLGWVTHTGRRDAREALEWFDRALALARELGDREAVARAWFNRGLVHAAEAEADVARRDFRQALAASAGTEALLLRKKAYKELGDLLLRAGDPEGAADLYRASLEEGLDRETLWAGAETLAAVAELDERIESVLSILPPAGLEEPPRRISPGDPIASAVARGDPGLAATAAQADPRAAARAAQRLEDRSRELRALALREYRRYAETLVGNEAATEVRAGSFVVRSDSPSERVVAGVAEVMDETAHLYWRLFGPSLAPAGALEATTVYLLSSEEDYDRLTGLFLKSADSRGHYVPGQEIIVLHLEREDRRDLVASAMHEAVHMLNHQLAGSHRRPVPPWLDEGLAMYFALTRIDPEGRVRFGKVDRSGGGEDGLETEVATWLKGLRKAFSEGSTLPLSSVVGEPGREPFHGPERHLYYSQSWTFIHFLLHGEEGGLREGFLAYLAGLSEGRSSKDHLEEALGGGLETLEEAWQDHVIYDL